MPEDLRGHHSVYVVLLDPSVLEIRKFLDANPNAAPWTTCLYVGMTGHDPEERFANHKAGHKANRFVRDFGIRLMPELYAGLNPMAFEDAVAEEAALADRLRSAGYAVWQK